MKATLSTGIEFQVEPKIVESPFGRFRDKITGRHYDVLLPDVKRDPSIIAPTMLDHPDFIGERAETNNERLELGIVIYRIRGRTLSRLAAISSLASMEFGVDYQQLRVSAEQMAIAFERLGNAAAFLDQIVAEIDNFQQRKWWDIFRARQVAVNISAKLSQLLKWLWLVAVPRGT